MSDTGVNAVATSSGLFANDFFKAVASVTPGNLIMSPMSADICLSMAAYGAGGNTATQMRNVLHLPVEDSLGQSGFHSLISTFNSVKNVKLSVANKVFINSGFKLKPAYKALTRDSFLSTSEEVDFGNGAVAANTINTWCEEKTNNRIKDVVKPDDFDALTRLVLVNAVYFKGDWKSKFDPANTHDRPFHVDENTTKMVPTMYMKSEFKYGVLAELNARFIELPYKGNELSMIIILPNEINGLKHVEENLHTLNLSQLRGYPREVELYLPKFKIESTIDLKDVLQKMGMTDMFDSRVANFAGIADEQLYVSKVIQKAFIEVNEEGSEAAAVTGLTLTVESAILFVEPTPVIRVDRPFYYMIIQHPERVVLFAGSTHHPTTA